MSDLTFSTDLLFGFDFFLHTFFMHLQTGITLNLYTHLEL